MRKGFDGLYGLPTQTLGRDVLRGDLFLFAGRDCLRAKPLYFDGTSLCLLHKRLSKGRFAAPRRDAQRTERSFTFSKKAVGPPGRRHGIDPACGIPVPAYQRERPRSASPKFVTSGPLPRRPRLLG
ncbi:MAG TPA: IS66 family insertion sequence element accessory protein TnpB, partial [Rhodocyclaceae bacterium]|nr:IS66 family insertion sequence element accessory protein TnpB [Rhodocyclaceae bacterium]